MRLARQDYWNELSFPSTGDLPNPGIEIMSPALVGRFFTTVPSRKPSYISRYRYNFVHHLHLADEEIKMQRIKILPEPNLSVQFRSVALPCPTLCDPMNRSTPGLPVHHQLPELTQIHAHRVGDAIQPSHPLSSPSPPAPNASQHQGLFQWVNSSYEVAMCNSSHPIFFLS